ncbi:MAG: zinc ribbon domain-containing protein [Myxococcota bacterium]
MKENLHKLLVLQEHDVEINKLEQEKQEMPQELESLKNDVSELEAILKKEIDSLEEVQTWKKNREKSLAGTEERIKKRIKDLDKVTTGKDYFGLQKELEIHRKKAREHEDEILKLMEVVEERQKVVQDRKKQLARFWKAVEKKEKGFAERMEKIDKELAKLNQERKELSSGIPKNLMRKYDFLTSKRFPAMVEAKEERCLGCNMGIPAQKFNSLYEVSSIVECPFCSRILYIKEALQD